MRGARGRIHGTHGRHTIFYQPDVDGKISAALDEFFGAVQRVYQKKRLTDIRDTSRRGLLFGHNGNPRRDGSQGSKNHGFSGLVRLGNRRRILLVLHHRSAAKMVPNDESGRHSCLNDGGEQPAAAYFV